MRSGSAYAILLPYLYASMIKAARQQQATQEAKNADHSDDAPEVVLSELFAIPRFMFGLIAQTTMMMSLQFLAPSLAVRLHSFGYTPAQVGLAYGIPAILYATTCPFIYLLTHYMQKRGLILAGYVFVFCAVLLIAGSSLVPLALKPSTLIFLGLVTIGLAGGMISIPILPEMLDAIEEDKTLRAKYD